MDILIGFLMVLEAIVCALLILIVLMQRPRQEGLGAAFGGGMTDQMFGAQTTNVLQKATTWLGIALFILTFTVAVLMSHRGSKAKELFDEQDLKPAATATVPDTEGNAPVTEAPKTEESATPAPAPATEAPKAEAPAPAAPAPAPAPAVPEAPKPEAAAPATPAPAPNAAPAPAAN